LATRNLRGSPSPSPVRRGRCPDLLNLTTAHLDLPAPAVTVVNAADVEPSFDAETGFTVRPTVGPGTGFAALEQAVLECPAGRTQTIEVGGAEQTLFVLQGSGRVEIGGEVHELEPEVGVYLPPASKFVLDNPGPETLQVVAVRVPAPELVAEGASPDRPAVCRVADRELEPATTDREFRIVADPETGLRSATHFVGYIPTVRSPEHFHTYDEVIYVLDGEGVMHAGEFTASVSAGACIQLPARTVHCLENTGAEPMRIVAVFRPAGSPAAAYYPDGTPAFEGGNQDQLQRRSQHQ
jgi:mannose-6-phosphate isomerase-like protein (cupin superfamily)